MSANVTDRDVILGDGSGKKNSMSRSASLSNFKRQNAILPKHLIMLSKECKRGAWSDSEHLLQQAQSSGDKQGPGSEDKHCPQGPAMDSRGQNLMYKR